MLDKHTEINEPEQPLHRCGSLFGCGDEQGVGVIREDLKDAAVNPKPADRLQHMDEIDQERLDGYLTARGRARRKLLRASGFMGALAAVQPWFAKLAQAADASATSSTGSQRTDQGRLHVVESNKESVRLGVFDANLPPLLTVNSGDTISFPNTWSHFLNELQPGVPVDKLAQLRRDNPGKGPHTIIGPIAVKNAEPGDVLEVRYRKFETYSWGAVFNNPGSLGTGLLPQDFPQGQVKYLDFDLHAMRGKFASDISIPLKPFQGTLGVAPPDGWYPPLTPGVTSSVPPGPHAGNTDLNEMYDGSTIFIPVWKPSALIFTGDSHAVQGDGEVNLSALETRMKDMRIQVILHKQKTSLGRSPRPHPLDHLGSRQGSEQGHDAGRAQCHQVPGRARQAHRTRCLCVV